MRCDACGVADERYMRYGAADESKDVGCKPAEAARDQIRARRQ